MLTKQERNTILNELGFQFDPFEYLEASIDPHLFRYIVNNDAFVVALQQGPSLVFARAGGGKTTMRLNAMQANWLTDSGTRSFPISYLLPLYARYTAPSYLENHLKGILKAGASALLIALAYRPELILNVDVATQIEIAVFLQIELPAPLTHYLTRLRASLIPESLSRQIERAYIIPRTPAAERVLELCDLLADLIVQNPRSNQESDLEYSLEARFVWMVELLCRRMGFLSVLLFLDGVDSFPETDRNPVAAVEWIRPLLEIAPHWADRGVYLKGFLPEEMEGVLLERAPETKQYSHAHLEWTRPLLVHLLERRIYVATEGKFDELDALSEHGFRNVEQILVERLTAPYLPREALRLAQLVLEEFLERGARGDAKLTMDDVARANSRYHAELSSL